MQGKVTQKYLELDVLTKFCRIKTVDSGVIKTQIFEVDYEHANH